jgi:hypothetical protein
MALDQPRNLPSGHRVFLPGEVADFIDAMERLDPRLCLVQRPDKGWSIWRNPEDGSPAVPVAHGPKGGGRLGPEILHRLAQHDGRRFDVADRMLKANEKHVNDVNAKADEDKMVAYDKMLSKAWKGIVPKTEEGFEAAL